MKKRFVVRVPCLTEEQAAEVIKYLRVVAEYEVDDAVIEEWDK